MKPVAIFRHSVTEGPGYFATFLDARQIPWQLIAIDRNEAIPASANDYSGLCLMGGPMSVNDPLPWIDPICALIQDAAVHGTPVIGHCLGGQLISKALGGKITRSPAKEIGWGKAQAESNIRAKSWLGRWLETSGGNADVFQWHGETFSIPPGGQRILTNKHCTNQVFAYGPHLAMQCHIEMTLEMIEDWCRAWEDEISHPETLPPTIQTPEQMLLEAPSRLPAMRELADQLYSIWIKSLKI